MVENPEGVPKALASRFQKIVALSDGFWRDHEMDEQARACRERVAALCRRRSSPIQKGWAKTWACGAVIAQSQMGQLSAHAPFRVKDICGFFKVRLKTGQQRAEVILQALKLTPPAPPMISMPMAGDPMAQAFGHMIQGFLKGRKLAGGVPPQWLED